MPGWSVNVVGWIQQFAEEEGLLLGVTLAGYAVDLWVRLFQASRSLERVKQAPTLGISKLPLLTSDKASSCSSSSSQGSFSEPSSSASSSSSAQPSSSSSSSHSNSGGAAASGSSSSRSDASSSADASDGGSSSREDAHSSHLTAGECSAVAVPGNDNANHPHHPRQEIQAARGDGLGSIVVVRGRVQASWDPHLWQRFSGPPLLKAENSKAKGVVVERIDKVVCSNVNQFLHPVSEHQVDVRRSQVPFELSEIPMAGLALPQAPSPPSVQLPSLASIPTPSLSFSGTPPSPRVRVSLEGLTQPLPLVTVHSAFHRSSPTLTSVLLHFLTGSQPIGQKVEERVLMAGTDLTAVGHVKRDKEGRPTITPAPDLPVFLTPLTKDQLIVHLTGTCTALFNTSVLFSAAAVATLGYVAYRKWDHRRRQERARRLLEDMAELERSRSRAQAQAQGQAQGQGQGQGQGQAGLVQNSGSASALGQERSGAARAPDAIDEEGNEDVSNIGNGELCVVCLSRRRRTVFVPCGHLACCMRCARDWRYTRRAPGCVVCRTAYTDIVRVYEA